MAGNNNNNRREDLSVAQYIWMGALEALINAFAEIDAATQAQVAKLNGLVIRLKTVSPYQTCYLLFTNEGIEVSAHEPGPVNIRLSGKLIDIVSILLGANARDKHKLHIWGDESSIEVIHTLLKDFNLRTASQRWLKENLNIDRLLGKVRGNDPSWLTDLLPMPGLIKQARADIDRLERELTKQKDEFRRYQQALQKQRFYDVLCFSVAFIVMSVGLSDSQLPAHFSELLNGQVILIVATVLLILSRLKPKA